MIWITWNLRKQLQRKPYLSEHAQKSSPPNSSSIWKEPGAWRVHSSTCWAKTLLRLTRKSLASTTANTTEQEITAWTQKHKEANAKWQFVPRVQCGFAFKNLMRAGCGAAQLSFRHLPLRRPEFKTSLNYIARPCLLPPHPTKKKKVMCNSSN